MFDFRIVYFVCICTFVHSLIVPSEYIRSDYWFAYSNWSHERYMMSILSAFCTLFLWLYVQCLCIQSFHIAHNAYASTTSSFNVKISSICIHSISFESTASISMHILSIYLQIEHDVWEEKFNKYEWFFFYCKIGKVKCTHKTRFFRIQIIHFTFRKKSHSFQSYQFLIFFLILWAVAIYFNQNKKE